MRASKYLASLFSWLYSRFCFLPNGFGQIELSLALQLDGFVCQLHGVQHVCFRHFVHFAFHHANVC